MNLGHVTFGSLDVLAADMVLQPGAQPSVCVITIAACNFSPVVDTLAFHYGDVAAVFPYAAVDYSSMTVHRGSDGGFYYKARVLDRRWLWKYLFISGEYNRRLDNGEYDLEYTPGGAVSNDMRQKSARELARLLLSDMTGADPYVDDLPNDDYPHVIWDHTNKGEALESLCGRYGCRICLTNDDRVGIYAAGTPGPEPSDKPIADDFYFQRGDIPARIRLVGAPTIVQHHYWCQSMGIDTDGAVKPKTSLSYYSGTGKARLPLSWYHLKSQPRALAMNSLGRIWKPVLIANGGGGSTWTGAGNDGSDVKWESIDQMVPLLNHLVASKPSSGGQRDSHKRARKPYLSYAKGVYEYSYNPTSYVGFPAGVKAQCWLPIDLDHDNAFVHTTIPLTDDEIVAVLAHHIRDYETGELLRYEKTIDVGGVGAEEVIWDESIRRVVVGDWSGGSSYTVTSNESAMSLEAHNVLVAAKRKYVGLEREQEYGGFLPVGPGNTVQSVRWTMQFGQPVYTHVTYAPQL